MRIELSSHVSGGGGGGELQNFLSLAPMDSIHLFQCHIVLYKSMKIIPFQLGNIFN